MGSFQKIIWLAPLMALLLAACEIGPIAISWKDEAQRESPTPVQTPEPTPIATPTLTITPPRWSVRPPQGQTLSPTPPPMQPFGYGFSPPYPPPPLPPGFVRPPPTPPPPAPRRISMDEFQRERQAKPTPAPGPAPQWVAYYNGSANSDDSPVALDLDSEGNVYVAGASKGNMQDSDYVTLKLDKYGRQLWAARYNGPGNGNDHAVAIAIDRDGNVYVTGTSQGAQMALTGSDFATIKYDKNGKQLWIARYDNDYKFDFATAIEVDKRGDVYVTGSSTGVGTSPRTPEYVVVKYNTDGNRLWVVRHDANIMTFGGIIPSHLALDNGGNIYLAGTAWSGSSRDYMLIKYDNEGKQLWKASYNGRTNGDDVASGLAIDPEGNAIVSGTSYEMVITSDVIISRVYDDITAVKYDGQGKELWAARFNGPDNSFDGGRAVAVDDEGNVYVAGSSKGPVIISGSIGRTGPYDAITIKYNNKGEELWTARYFAPTGDRSDPLSIAVDSKSNAYLTGISYLPQGGRDYFTVKYDKQGKAPWILYHEMDVKSVRVDGEGNLYVIGTRVGQDAKTDIVVVTYLAYR